MLTGYYYNAFLDFLFPRIRREERQQMQHEQQNRNAMLDFLLPMMRPACRNYLTQHSTLLTQGQDPHVFRKGYLIENVAYAWARECEDVSSLELACDASSPMVSCEKFWQGLSGNPVAVPLLERHLDRVDWDKLSGNRAAVPLLERHPDRVNWYIALRNPAARPLLERHPDHVDWNYVFAYDSFVLFKIDNC
jgi:hypothetical protein